MTAPASRKNASVKPPQDRYGPQVVQRRHRFTGLHIVVSRLQQLPVLVKAQAGQCLIGECLPPGLRLDEHSAHRAHHHHEHQRRQQPTRGPSGFGHQRRRAHRADAAEYATADEEAGQDQ